MFTSKETVQRVAAWFARKLKGSTNLGMTANYTQERSVDHRGAQVLRTGIVAGRSGKRYASRTVDQAFFNQVQSSRGYDGSDVHGFPERVARYSGAALGGGVVVAFTGASAERALAKVRSSSVAAWFSNDSWLAETPTHNKSPERTGDHRGRAVLAIDCVLAGAERAAWPAAHFNR